MELLEIQRALKAVENVDKSIVICFHAGKVKQALVAFVVPKNRFDKNSNQQGNQIEKNLRTKLRDFEMPQVFVVESIPLLPNGKVDEEMLFSIFESRKDHRKIKMKQPIDHFQLTFNLYAGDIDYNFDGIYDERLEVAKEVFEIVGKTVKNSVHLTISPESNFYALGGNSLNLITTIGQLSDKGYSIGVVDFISAKNLGEIVEKICEGRHTSDEVLSKFKTIPLTVHHKYQVIS